MLQHFCICGTYDPAACKGAYYAKIIELLLADSWCVWGQTELQTNPSHAHIIKNVLVLETKVDVAYGQITPGVLISRKNASKCQQPACTTFDLSSCSEQHMCTQDCLFWLRFLAMVSLLSNINHVSPTTASAVLVEQDLE